MQIDQPMQNYVIPLEKNSTRIVYQLLLIALYSLLRLRHKNIVRLLDIYDDKERVYLVMEL